MRTINCWRVLLFFGLSGALVATQFAAAQTQIFEEHNVSNQFTISLPEGWSTYDQGVSVLRKTDRTGLVIFSAESIVKPSEVAADPDLLGKMDAGEITSFFVDRILAGKKDTCERLPSYTTYDIGVRVAEDPSVGALRRYFSSTPPRSTKVRIGGCNGVKFVIESRKDDPRNHWVLDVRAVSDGDFIYLFSLRHKAEYYAQTLPVFEAALETVKFEP